MNTQLDFIFGGGSNTWELLKEGGGGYIPGLGEIADDGTKYCRTDVCGFYVWKAGDIQWRPIYSLNNFEEGTERQAGGYTACWEIACSVTNPERAYVIQAGPDNFALARLYKTDNYGDLWEWTGAEFYGATGQGDWNSKFCQRKVVVDPNNPDVVYCGLPNYGADDATGACLRAIDGETFEPVTDIPPSVLNPGCAGIAFDRYGGTVSVDGQTRTARIIVPSAGNGIWESTDGGVTWDQISSDPPPDTSVSITTTTTDTMVVAMISTFGSSRIKSVKMGGVDMHRRATTFGTAGYYTGLYNYLHLYYLPAATAASHTVVVEHYDGGKEYWCDLKLIAVEGVETSTPATQSTVWGPASSTKELYDTAISVTANDTNDFFIAFAKTSDTTPDSGWTSLTMNGRAYSEYQIDTGTKSVDPDDGSSRIADALKQKSGGTLALNAQAFGSSSASSNIGPTRVFNGKMTATGTYWCFSGPYIVGSVTGDLWRYKDSTWTKQVADFSTTEVGLCVDPRPLGVAQGPNTIYISGPNAGWYGQCSFNAEEDSPTWVGSTGGHNNDHTTTSPNVPWQDTTALVLAVGDFEVDPLTGQIWLGNGYGVVNIDPTLNYDTNNYFMNYEWRSEGIEELVATFVLEPATGEQILAGVNDRSIMQCRIGKFPLRNYEEGYGAHCWDLDWSSDDPDFIVAAISQFFFGGQTTSSYSDDAGATWQRFTSVPESTTGDRANANSSSGHGGCIASASPTNHVITLGQGWTQPQYTTDNGATAWLDTDLPWGYYSSRNNVAAYNTRSKCLAADRVDIGTFYCLNIGTNGEEGFYRSTNGGANWTKVSGNPLTYAFNGFSIWSVPEHEGHLFYSVNYYAQAPVYSTDGGATWTALSGVTSTTLFTIGKKSPGSPYGCDVYLWGIIPALSANPRFYHGVALGATPASGYTWTDFGGITDLPDGGLDAAQSMTASMRNVRRVFLSYNSTGALVYNAIPLA